MALGAGLSFLAIRKISASDGNRSAVIGIPACTLLVVSTVLWVQFESCLIDVLTRIAGG
jgi:hypothetical protein